ncbi:unnamed protein product [Clonostachys rosea]|uniref:Uncharacterized protein n=1 Tax=Bionectria ochroleuca TaxID=29856 RepID=A0ABY6UP84_BIOOC|nr:unnamed protein product [Clonostachys rosea]
MEAQMQIMHTASALATGLTAFGTHWIFRDWYLQMSNFFIFKPNASNTYMVKVINPIQDITDTYTTIKSSNTLGEV